jgi:hypothetical protein
MSEGVLVPKKPRLILRILSVLTLSEGGIGLLLSSLNLITLRLDYVSVGGSHPAWLSYATASIGLMFNIALVAAGVLLWKLRRKGLVLLTGVLITELMSLIFMSSAPVFGASSKEHGYLTGMGLLPFTPQIATAFPIVAGVLIFLAYRHLGIPARE